MGLEVVPYLPAHEAAVRRLNQRLVTGGADPEMQFPETADPGWLPGMELRVALEDTEVRGGYILRRQQFWAAGEICPVAHYRLPLSEGLVNRSYATLALRLVRDALAQEARLYALGMGGRDKPLPQMLKRLGWRMAEVPFFFRVLHPYPFLRQIRPLRSSALRRLACDAAAFSGLGWAAMRLTGLAGPVSGGGGAGETAPGDVWERSRAGYALSAVRDAATVDLLYPPSDPRFLRVRASHGWAVLLDTPMKGHKQFGDLRVGTIVDCLASSQEDAARVVRKAAHTLQERGVDLIISNQLHHFWTSALEAAGFRRGPSNFLLALSPALASRLEGRPDTDMHMNRGDGDGPIHL